MWKAVGCWMVLLVLGMEATTALVRVGQGVQRRQPGRLRLRQRCASRGDEPKDPAEEGPEKGDLPPREEEGLAGEQAFAKAAASLEFLRTPAAARMESAAPVRTEERKEPDAARESEALLEVPISADIVVVAPAVLIAVLGVLGGFGVWIGEGSFEAVPWTDVVDISQM